MAKYLLSKSAVADIEKIADYTISNFGLNQARLYRGGLISFFQYLTERPEIGRPYSATFDIWNI